MSEKDVKYITLVETLKKNILGGKYDVRNPFPSMRALISRVKEKTICFFPCGSDWL